LHFKDRQYHSFPISFFIKAIPLLLAFLSLANGNYPGLILDLLAWMSLLPAGNFIGVLGFKLKFVFLFICIHFIPADILNLMLI